MAVEESKIDRHATADGGEMIAGDDVNHNDREAKDGEGRKRGKGKVVVVAMDGSNLSTQALHWVLENLVFRKAERDEDSDEIVLFHTQQVPPANCNLGITTQEMIDAIKMQEEEAAVEVLESGKTLCEEHKVKVRTIVKSGDPRDHICEIVEKEQANVLVMGNNGHGTLKRLLLGSTSDHCVHRVKCHVIIAKDLR
ncbi:universal stress protein A-like protein isoform X2 [Selaginella moellendorffii]|uniref:universal stress protein A-like protein isoform X2 n=1 Tax=Selaginella moellendorffii TaxID=88036 RepID=UPI000D1CE6C0|nr:universal stress protein A-like protein isoform X2 [Selaginella moellendorffii]|eukprot:XP_024540977.1 universal stress protein A-like protein isoform X2 [Selaginella moellendorffii]